MQRRTLLQGLAATLGFSPSLASARPSSPTVVRQLFLNGVLLVERTSNQQTEWDYDMRTSAMPRFNFGVVGTPRPDVIVLIEQDISGRFVRHVRWTASRTAPGEPLIVTDTYEQQL